MSRYLFFVLVIVSLVVVACGGGTATKAAGNAENGKVLFAQAAIGSSGAAGCAVCHSTQAGTVMVGPSLAGMGSHAASAFKEADYKGAAKSAAEWLNESIVKPDVDVAEGFPPSVMPGSYGVDLTSAQIDDLVAYLLTLK